MGFTVPFIRIFRRIVISIIDLFRVVILPEFALFRAVEYNLVMIERFYKLENLVNPKKVIIIFGPRQVGKTTLVENYLASLTSKNVRYITGEDYGILDYFEGPYLKKLEEFVAGYDMLVIDEAQKIANIGNALKLIVDRIKTIEIIVTGSASFELAGQVGEPLTGRKQTLNLYPIAQLELNKSFNKSELKQQLEDFLVYGSYPEVISAKHDLRKKRKLLDELLSSYLLKDIFELEKIKSSKILWDLLRLLAFQIGSEVSHNELANKLGINKKTVGRYLDLLEKAFVLHSVRGFSSNLRKEITRKNKYYFLDNGIRNALVGNLNTIETRNDVGQLWENFIFMERLKKRHYTGIYGNEYFWRTWDKKEIDLVEERDDKLFGYEFKWGKKLPKAPKDWLETYHNATYEIIDQDNYLDFIT